MPRFDANLTMLFNEVGFLERFSMAANAGFDGVEYAYPYPYDKQQLVDRLGENNLRQILHNLPSGNWDSGERGIACLPDRINEFQDGVGKAVEYATYLGCKQVNCLAGITPENVPQDAIYETMISNLTFAATKLGEKNIDLLVEAVNTRDVPGFFVTSTQQVRSIINEIGLPNIGLQYDVYHMQIMQGDIVTTMKENLDVMKHIQIADNPGRNEPGTGEINYPFIFQSLDIMGYEGWIGCEYIPINNTVSGLQWASQYLPGR